VDAAVVGVVDVDPEGGVYAAEAPDAAQFV
jgi:hypothetical protein